MPACIEEFTASPDSEGVNIIGLVSHAGIATDRSVAQVAIGVDFIVSAHSHTPMFPEMLGDCLNYTAGTCECAALSSKSTVSYFALWLHSLQQYLWFHALCHVSALFVAVPG